MAWICIAALVPFLMHAAVSVPASAEEPVGKE